MAEVDRQNVAEEEHRSIPKVDRLEEGEQERIVEKVAAKPFTIKTNTFGVKLNEPDLNVLEYQICVRPKPDDDDQKQSPSPSSSKRSPKQKDLAKYLNRFSRKWAMKKHFGEYKIDNSTVITVRNQREPIQRVIAFPEDFDESNLFSFKLLSTHSLGFIAGLHDAESDRNISDDPDAEDGVDEKVENAATSTAERRSQVLQLILHSILSRSGLKYITFGGTRGWFPCTLSTKLNVVTPVYRHPASAALADIGVLRGIKASLCRSQQGLALKVSNLYKLLQSQSLQHRMGDIQSRDPSNYKLAVRRLIGRKALYIPTQSVVEIESIDLDQDEQSTFTTNRGGKTVTISYESNLLDHGHVDAVKPEPFGVVKDERGFSFLPQFMYLLFNADRDRVGPLQRKEALKHLAEDRDLEMESIQSFVDHIVAVQGHDEDDAVDRNEDEMNMLNVNRSKRANGSSGVNVLSLLTISSAATRTAAYPLPEIGISIKGARGESVQCSGTTISSSWRQIHGLQIPIRRARRALIVGEGAAVQTVHGQIDRYFRRRQFGCNILSEIAEHAVNPREISNVRFVVERLDFMLKGGRYGLVILILPSILSGSKLKRAAHRKCLELGVTSQFLLDEVCYSRNDKRITNTVWSMMADVVYKMGGSAYSVRPHLTTGNLRINVNRTMMMGLDICHPTRIRNGSTNRPSIAVLTSFYGDKTNDVMTPNIEHQKAAMFLNANRREICSFDAVKAMALNVLRQQLLRNDVDQLPLNLMMLRDGVSDSQIAAMTANELNAVMAAVGILKNEKAMKQKYESIKKWRPNFEWILCQKRILDRFSPNGKGRRSVLRAHSPSFIVPSDIVSGEYFEFYHQIGTRSPSRMLVIKDDMGLRNGGLMDLALFIDATHWLYPPSIPFVCGQLSYPGPIKVADHHANVWQEMIGRGDCSIDDIKSSDKLPNPQLVRL